MIKLALSTHMQCEIENSIMGDNRFSFSALSNGAEKKPQGPSSAATRTKFFLKKKTKKQIVPS